MRLEGQGELGRVTSEDGVAVPYLGGHLGDPLENSLSCILLCDHEIVCRGRMIDELKMLRTHCQSFRAVRPGSYARIGLWNVFALIVL